MVFHLILSQRNIKIMMLKKKGIKNLKKNNNYNKEITESEATKSESETW